MIRDIESCLENFPEAEIIGDDWDYKEVRDAVKYIANKYNKDLYIHGNKCWTFSGKKCEANLKIIKQEEKLRIGIYNIFV